MLKKRNLFSNKVGAEMQETVKSSWNVQITHFCRNTEQVTHPRRLTIRRKKYIGLQQPTHRMRVQSSPEAAIHSESA